MGEAAREVASLHVPAEGFSGRVGVSAPGSQVM